MASPSPSCCVLVSDLPLTATPHSLQLAIEQATNDQLVWPQQPHIHEEQALVYLPSMDLVNKVTTPNLTLSVNGQTVTVRAISAEEEKQWIHQRTQQNEQNRTSSPNDTNDADTCTAQETAVCKNDVETAEEDETKNNPNAKHEDGRKALYNILPQFVPSRNVIVWYQYKIHMNDKPFFVTYPAEWSYEIECQWEEFQEKRSLNADGAEQNHSKFTIGELNLNNNSHAMIGDLMKMTVTDRYSSKEYELKRTKILVGNLVKYGFIQFERYYHSQEKEIFLYDRKNGYLSNNGDNAKHSEINIKPGDKVVFEAWWNMDDEDVLIYDFNQRYLDFGITNEEILHSKVHANMVAFNVRRATAEDIEQILGNPEAVREPEIVSKIVNPLVRNLGDLQPLLAKDFRGQRFEGLLIAINLLDSTGLIVCFPFDDKPKESVTLLFHIRYMKNSQDATRLSVNMNLEFTIGVNPMNFGQGLYGYVATDIIIVERVFSNPFMPCTETRTERHLKGRIIVPPKSIQQCGWIYNDSINNMTQLRIHSEDELQQFQVGKYVRYNERKIARNPDEHERDKYDILADDVLTVDRISNISQYLRVDQYVKYKAKRYILGRKLKIDEDRNFEFKDLKIEDSDTRDFSDMFLIIEQAEIYINALLNSTGGAVFFGVRENGTIVGQQQMTKNKRDYIMHAISQRAEYCKPAVRSEYYQVRFIEVVDLDGFFVPDCYVLIIHVAKLFARDDLEQSIQFETSQAQIYERRLGSNGRGTKLRCLKPQQLQPLLKRPKDKQIENEIESAVKPQFIGFKDSCSDEGSKKHRRYSHDHENEDEKVEKASTMTTHSGSSSSSRHSSQRSRHSHSYLHPHDQPLQASDITVPFENSRRHQNKPQQQQQQRQQHEQQQQRNMYHSDLFGGGGGGHYNSNTNVPQAMQYTTPHLNAAPIPENTEQGLQELTSRVQQKLNAMMKIEEYMLDPKWSAVLQIASQPRYNNQKSAWKLMQSLEQETLRKRNSDRTKAVQQNQDMDRRRQNTQDQQMRGYVQNQRNMEQQIRELQQQQQRQQRQINTNTNSNANTSTNNEDSSKSSGNSGKSAAYHAAGFYSDPLQQQNAANTASTSNQSISEQYARNFSGQQQLQTDQNGFPILSDKSKYKAVAMEYCQKMGWKRPVEQAEMYGNGYRATVTFGQPGREKTEIGHAQKQKAAIYEAYFSLIPKVIPKHHAIELMVKWVAGYEKVERVSTTTIGQAGQSINKHPKSVLLEWAQKNSIAPPQMKFSEFTDSTRNLRIWTASVMFCGRKYEAKASKKKDAEYKCFEAILQHVMSGGMNKQQ